VQGYFISRPVDADEVVDFVADSRRRIAALLQAGDLSRSPRQDGDPSGTFSLIRGFRR